MKESMMLDIPKTLDEISDAVMISLSYKPYPLHKLEMTIQTIDAIVSDPSNLKQCEECLKSTGTNYVLFFLSNIIYNLKRQGELMLTDEIIKWLGSVWKNFLKRNKSYQELFPAVDEYRTKLGKYYPLGASFINQLENVSLIKDDFIDDAASDDGALRKLEKFYQSASETLSAMKPSYFFLLDYYYEKKINTGADSSEAVALEVGGLNKFGQPNYTYREIMVLTCQVLGILEAAYLLLKKKKSQRRLINVSGKQKFLTASEIYTVYLEKFNSMKKELVNLNK
jgi:hypothetical protein